MKIAVIGTGAMGGIYAGLLADAGHEVWAIDLWQKHLEAIAKQGLRVEGASGNRTVRNIQVSTQAADAGLCDLIIIATKAAGVAAAAQSIQPLMKKETLVLAMQNGLGAGERMSQHLPQDQVLIGVAGGFGASIKAPGHVHHHGMELIRVGEMQGGLTERVERIARLWNEAGFQVKAFENIQQLVWEKFICNCAVSGPCAVFYRTIGEMMADPNAWKISLNCGVEAYEAGRAKGVPFSFEDPQAYIEAFARKVPGSKPSLLQDQLANRLSEIDAINGMVPVVAKEAGTSAPYNEVVTAIIKARESQF